VRVETDLKKVPKSLWIKDCKSNICNVCLNKITGGWVKSGKHHCRYCGHIVCGTCSGHAVFESKSTYHRICDRCFNQTTKSKTKKSSKGKRESSKLHSRSRHLSTPITTPRSPVLRPLSTPSIVDEDRRLCPLSPPNNKTGSVQDKKRKLTITYHQSSHPEWSESDILTKPYWENRRDILVRGYLRGQYRENEIPWLPQDIVNTLIEWSFINDVWKQYGGNHCDDHISITNSALSICRVSKSNEHCYYGFGRDVVTTDHIKTWNVRLDKVDYYTNNYCSMIIGVAEVGKVNWIKSLLGDFTYGCYRGYGLRVAERCRFVHQHSNQPIFISKGSLKKGDIIRVTLDLSTSGGNGEDSKYGSLGFAFEDGYGNNIQYGMNEEFGWMGHRKHIAFEKVRRDRAYVLVVGMYCQNKITFVEECNT